MSSRLKFSLNCCLCLFILAACNKEQYLNENPAPNLQVPDNLDEIQSLLENDVVLNVTPGMGDASSDNYYLPHSSWMILPVKDQNTYLWASDIFMGIGGVPDWDKPYEQIFYSNVALKALNKIKKNADNESRWNKLKGTALFFRAMAYHNLSQLFTAPYDSASAANDWGLPLRLNDNILEVSERASLQKTYDQIIGDLTEAKDLLPREVDAPHPNRPTLPAVYALLSKVYLASRNYEMARNYADGCLAIHNKLLDYNTINAGITLPFKINNPEIIFYSQASTSDNFLALVSRGTIIDSGLYRSYDSNDLRRSLYYSSTVDAPYIRSSYTGTIFPFGGLATDELFLIKAECLARAGKIDEALNNLNTLLINRWKRNTFVPFAGSHAEEVLQLVLSERRKELPFRNCRWTDLRRLNKEGHEILLTRIINDSTYQLLPNSKKYTLPIPPDVIALSGMTQNPR